MSLFLLFYFQLYEEPATILARQSPLNTSSTDCISNDEMDKVHGESELEVIMEAELENKRRSSEVAADLNHLINARQCKLTMYDSSSQQVQDKQI